MPAGQNKKLRNLLYFQGTYLLLLGSAVLLEKENSYINLLPLHIIGNVRLLGWLAIGIACSLLTAAMTKNYQIPSQLTGLITATILFLCCFWHYPPYFPVIPYVPTIILHSMLFVGWVTTLISRGWRSLERIWEDPFLE